MKSLQQLMRSNSSLRRCLDSPEDFLSRRRCYSITFVCRMYPGFLCFGHCRVRQPSSQMSMHTYVPRRTRSLILKLISLLQTFWAHAVDERADTTHVTLVGLGNSEHSAKYNHPSHCCCVQRMGKLFVCMCASIYFTTIVKIPCHGACDGGLKAAVSLSSNSVAVQTCATSSIENQCLVFALLDTSLFHPLKIDGVLLACSLHLLLLLAQGWSDPLGSAAIDYAVQQRAFVFNLSPDAVAHPHQAARFDAIAAHLAPLGVLSGWAEPESAMVSDGESGRVLVVMVGGCDGDASLLPTECIRASVLSVTMRQCLVAVSVRAAMSLSHQQ